jgi:hypothetical protein
MMDRFLGEVITVRTQGLSVSKLRRNERASDTFRVRGTF